MKKIYILILVLFSLLCFAQAPPIQWQKTIGGSLTEELNSIKQTSDGGYILGGYSYSSISGEKTEANLGQADYWIVRTNSTGTIIWQNTIGGNDNDYLTSVHQTSDGGYILGGYSFSPISGDKTENVMGQSDYWIVKVDSGGTIQWQNTIGGNAREELFEVRQTNDGGYVLAGYSNSDISGDKTENSIFSSYDYWVVKINAAGTIVWQNTIGGNGNDELRNIIQTVDGGYLLSGSSDSNISGDKTENSNGNYDYWIVKINSVGIISWQNTIGGNSLDQLESIDETADGGFILGGFSGSGISGDKTEGLIGIYDMWILKVNSLGVIQWQNTIGGANDDRALSIEQTTDGEYIVGGYSLSNIGGDKTENSNGNFDYWVLKLNTLGTIDWQNTIGGSNYDELQEIHQTADGGFIIAGFSNSNISGDKSQNSRGFEDYWIIKLAPECISPIMSSISATDTVLCVGESATINFSGSLNSATKWYLFQNTCGGIPIDSSTTTSFNVTPFTTTTYYIRGGGGCVSGGTCMSITIHVNSLPLINAGMNDTICINDSIILNASGGVSYVWNNGIGSTNPVNISPLVSTTYAVIGTDINGCSNSDSLTIVVNSLQLINAGMNDTICMNDSAILNASGGVSYVWSHGIGSTNPVNISPLVSTTYAVIGTDANGCSNTDSLTIVVNSLPLITFQIQEDSICVNYTPITLTASPSGGIFSGTGVSGNSFDPNAAGIGNHLLMYLFTDVNGCSNSSTDSILVIGCAGIENNFSSPIKVFPNPMIDVINIDLNDISQEEIVSIKLLDHLGRELKVYGNFSLVIPVTDLAKGIYLLEIKTIKGNIYTSKLMK